MKYNYVYKHVKLKKMNIQWKSKLQKNTFYVISLTWSLREQN